MPVGLRLLYLATKPGMAAHKDSGLVNCIRKLVETLLQLSRLQPPAPLTPAAVESRQA